MGRRLEKPGEPPTMVKNAGILQEMKERQFFQKPSEKKRLAKKAGKKRWLKRVAQMENDY